jgi:phosphate uptake regulator
MAAQASVELSLVLDAFTDGSLALADALRDVDDVMNGLLRDIIRAVTQDPGADEAGVAGLVQAVLAARILERIGDGAVDCADRIRFWLTGATPTTRDEDPVVPTR